MNNSALKIFKSHVNIDKKIYVGDGEIWTIKNKPTRLVKVVKFDPSTKYKLKEYKKFFTYILSLESSPIVKIHEHGYFIYNDYTYYYYIMDKLIPLPQSDSMVAAFIEEYVFNRRKIPTFFSKKLTDFIIVARKIKYYYDDLHSKNIMLDRYGNYKFIDLESFFD